MRSWQVWERPDTELRAQHHGQFRRLAPQDPGEARGGARVFTRRWRRWAAVPGNGPARLTARGQLGLGGAKGGPGAVRRHAVVGEVTRAGRMGAVQQLSVSLCLF